MTRLRLAFMGTPDFAVPALDALVEAGHEVACVYCQPPKPAGRGHEVQKTPVHRRADARSIPVRTPKTLRDPEAQAAFRDLNLDAAVVAAYGLILPQPVLDAPRLGCVNIHASLLPRWRGAAPIHRALLAGDAETGITIMQMDAGLDTGPMLAKSAVPIGADATAQALHDTLAALGARMIVETLDGLARGTVTPEPQPDAGVTYASKLTKDEGRLDWTRPAVELARRVRALTPWPGGFFDAPNGERLKVLEAVALPGSGVPGTPRPGTVVDEAFGVACGEGVLRLVTVQRPGRGPTDGAACQRGLRLAAGAHLS
ncbi:MAG TPA: methionyl-tRNA formyltransferase [Azospirillaceae bacterium]|nr:methionyl-tRNA formyltransferase [Azospirillaceae bacterium]